MTLRNPRPRLSASHVIHSEVGAVEFGTMRHPSAGENALKKGVRTPKSVAAAPHPLTICEIRAKKLKKSADAVVLDLAG
jgi:hypothetical protein